MQYLRLVRNVYESIIHTDFTDVINKSEIDFDEINKNLQAKFRFVELRESYIDVLNKTINQYLPFFKDDFNNFLKIKEVSFYYFNISTSTASHLFWIWSKNLDFSDDSLNKFIQSFFLGVFGYKMIDFHNDNRNSNPELNYVGLYAIKIAEQLLENIIGSNITNSTYLKYAKMFAEIEYVEKKSKWKPSVFSWDDLLKLGWKAAPTYIVYESLFRYAKYTETKIEELMKALLNLSAALQLIDDLADAKLDLVNGYETLVMSGYYNRFGISSDITEAEMGEVLTQERLMLIYQSGQNLFSKARKIFEKHNEYILQLLIEAQNLNFTSLFEINKRV